MSIPWQKLLDLGFEPVLADLPYRVSLLLTICSLRVDCFAVVVAGFSNVAADSACDGFALLSAPSSSSCAWTKIGKRRDR